MSVFLRKWGLAILAFILTAAASYWTVLGAVPGFVMDRAWTTLAERGSANSAEHVGRITAQNQTIVRTSPDLIYSTCPFDISEKPLNISFDPIAGHYWSITIFDGNTDAAFVLNDRQAGAGPVQIDVTHGNSTRKNSVDAATSLAKASVEIPTGKGVALLRVLVNGEEDFQNIDAQRKRFKCRVMDVTSAI